MRLKRLELIKYCVALSLFLAYFLGSTYFFVGFPLDKFAAINGSIIIVPESRANIRATIKKLVPGISDQLIPFTYNSRICLKNGNRNFYGMRYLVKDSIGITKDLYAPSLKIGCIDIKNYHHHEVGSFEYSQIVQEPLSPENLNNSIIFLWPGLTNIIILTVCIFVFIILIVPTYIGVKRYWWDKDDV